MSAATAESYSAVETVLMTMGRIDSRRPPIVAVVYSLKKN